MVDEDEYGDVQRLVCSYTRRSTFVHDRLIVEADSDGYKTIGFVRFSAFYDLA